MEETGQIAPPALSSPDLQESSETFWTEFSRKLDKDLEEKDVLNMKLQELCSYWEKNLSLGEEKVWHSKLGLARGLKDQKE